jgi:hypothetical protein
LVTATGELKLKWGTGHDDTTPDNGLYYNFRVGTISGSSDVVTGRFGTPLLGDAMKGNLSGGVLGALISPARLKDGVTYYWSVQTIDAGLRASNWSVERSTTCQIPPGRITTLTAATSSQIALSWTAPGDNMYQVASGTAAVYEIRYSSAMPPFNWNLARIWKNTKPVTGLCGRKETEMITGLNPDATYYFAIKTKDKANNWSVISTTASAIASAFYKYWTAPTTDVTLEIALGDFNNDGYLDLAVGNYGYTKVYLNNGNLNGNWAGFTLAWKAPQFDWTRSVAWGDYDNDGYLDLAIGNNGYIKVYRNNNGTGNFGSSPAWISSISEDNKSVAWGDYDNDGYLDLAVGIGTGQSNRVYHNNGNGTFTSVWLSQYSEQTYAIAWGDYNNDGYLDLAVGNNTNLGTYYDRVYRNNNGNGTFSSVWTAPSNDYTQSIAWGDYDNDGYLDLAVGNSYQANKVYHNTNGTGNFSLSSGWTAPITLDNTRSIA